MVIFRLASLAILAMWVGGLAVLGLVAAPTIFSSLEAHDPAGGRAVAGMVFGQVFERFQHWAWAFAALFVATLAGRTLLGPRPHRLAWRLTAVAGMLALSLTSTLVLTPRIDEIRKDASGSVAALPDTDPRKSEFGRLHGMSTVFMLTTLLLGLGLLYMEADENN